MIVKRYLNNIFELEKSVSVKSPYANFTLKISTHQDLASVLFTNSVAFFYFTECIILIGALFLVCVECVGP